MSDRLGDRIREAVHELVATSPAPPERPNMLQPQSTTTPRRALHIGSRRVAVALLVLAVGTAGILVGRFVFPLAVDDVSADDAPEIIDGQIAPEPQFDTAGLGTEVPLLSPSGLRPHSTITAGGDEVVGDILAVGRLAAHEAEGFTWRTLREDVEGWCIQIVTQPTVAEACSADRVPPTREAPRTVTLASDSTLVMWRVPEGTSVVSLQVGDLRVWQRPVAGVAFFVVQQPSTHLGYLHAWDTGGVQLVEIGFTVSDPTTMATGVVHGALPNGQAYVVSGLPGDVHEVEGLSAAILLDRSDGSAWAIGIAHFFGRAMDVDLPIWDGDTLRVPTGDGSVRIQVYTQVLDDLGPGGRDLLANAIKGSSVSGMPVLQLAPPLRFARDLEVPLHMAAQYPMFSVLRGCDQNLGGVVCSDEGRIQVVPNTLLYSGDYLPLPPTVRITEVDPGLDPWPLSPIDIQAIWALRIFEAGGQHTSVEVGLNALSAPWLEIGANSLGGDGGCNVFDGDYQLEGNTLVATRVSQRLMLCQGLMAAEEAFLGMLAGGEVHVQVGGGEMWWTSGDARLRFVEVDSRPPDSRG